MADAISSVFGALLFDSRQLYSIQACTSMHKQKAEYSINIGGKVQVGLLHEVTGAFVSPPGKLRRQWMQP